MEPLYDPKSDSHISLLDGQIQVTKSDATLAKTPLYLSSDLYPPAKHFEHLKFLKKNSSNIVLNPAGTALVCKSDRIQEVEMNQSFEKGSVCWEIHVPHSVLSLAVGLRSAKTNKYSLF